MRSCRCAVYNCSFDIPRVADCIARLKTTLCAPIFPRSDLRPPTPPMPNARCITRWYFSMFKNVSRQIELKSVRRVCTFNPPGTRTGWGSACWLRAQMGPRQEWDRRGRSRGSCCPVWHSHSARLLAAARLVTCTAPGSGIAGPQSARSRGEGAVVRSAVACWAGTAAGTARSRSSVRWGLGRPSCRLAHRIPVLYARGQSRTNIALCIRVRKKGRVSLPS